MKKDCKGFARLVNNGDYRGTICCWCGEKEDAHNAQKLEWARLWEAMEVQPYPWIETTPAMFDAMLGAVPPQDRHGGAFLVGEPKTHNADGEAVYACFVEHAEGAVMARYMTQREFNTWKEIRK